jgi:hypothetical protein
MMFLQNKGKVRRSSVGTKDSLILKSASLFVDRKYNKNLSLLSMNQCVLSEVCKNLGKVAKERDILDSQRDESLGERREFPGVP